MKVEDSLHKECDQDILSQQKYHVKPNPLVDSDDEIEIVDYIPGNSDCEMMSPIQKRKIGSSSQSMEGEMSYQGEGQQQVLMSHSVKRSRFDMAISHPPMKKEEHSMNQGEQEQHSLMFGSLNRSQFNLATSSPVMTKEEELLAQYSTKEITNFAHGQESQNFAMETKPMKKYYDAYSEVEMSKTELVP